MSLKAAGGEAACASAPVGRLDVGARNQMCASCEVKAMMSVMLPAAIVTKISARKANIEASSSFTRCKQLRYPCACRRRKDHRTRRTYRLSVAAVKPPRSLTRHRMSADDRQSRTARRQARVRAPAARFTPQQVHKDRVLGGFPPRAPSPILPPQRGGWQTNTRSHSFKFFAVSGASMAPHIRAMHHGLLHRRSQPNTVCAVRALMLLGHRASDEAEADNADCHSLTTLSSRRIPSGEAASLPARRTAPASGTARRRTARAQGRCGPR